MGPDELNSRLTNLGAGGRNQSALALYEGVRENDIVDEDIDERILKLLGLDGVYDIDYGTYISLLKERLAASRSFGKQLSVDEDELLISEFKKIKGKVGRFKIRKKKITSENLGVTGPIKISTEKFYLTSKAVIPQPSLPPGKETSDDVKSIVESLDSIANSLLLQNKEAKKRSEENRKADEQRRRVKREAELEKPIKKALGLVKKIVAPFQSILDRIMRFIQFTLLGFFVDKVLKWFADPNNEKKVKLIGRFLKDWWPALAFAAGLFLTPLGKFVRTTLRMLRGFLPTLLNFVKTNPLTAAGLTTGLATGTAEMWRQKEEKKQIEKEASKRRVKPEVVQKEVTEAKSSPFAMFGQAMQNIGLTGYSTGGRIRKRSFFGDQEVNVNDIAFAGGGGIDDGSGLRITGAGPDTQLIAAQPGEVVMSKKAVDKYGANFFLGLNKKAGGTNIPKMVNNIQLARGGGLVNRVIRTFSGGGMVGSSDSGYRSTSSSSSRFNIPRFSSPSSSASFNMGSRMSSSPSSSSNFVSRPLTSLSRPSSSSSSPSKFNISMGSMGSSSSSSSRSPISFRSLPGLNLNFNQNIQTLSPNIQERIVREFNTSTEYSVSSAINLGPRQTITPVGTPVIISSSKTIVLPPQKISSNKSGTPVKTGTQIPDVKIVAAIPHREMVIRSLGIGDLMGAV